MSSLIGHLQASLATHADRKAVEGTSWVLTYRDLDHEVGRLASLLKRAGLRRGQQVPMLMGRSPQFIVGLLAVLRCGAAYVPIDQSSPPSRQQAMLEALDSPVALTDATMLVTGLEKFAVIDVAHALAVAKGGPPPAWPHLPPDAPAYAMFTSGSTGTPKGVLVPHRAIDRLVWEPDYLQLDENCRWGQMSSIAFDASTLEIWAPLLHGGCCVVQEDPLPSLDMLAEFIEERHLTDAWLTAALFNVMVDDWLPAFAGLRQLLTGGERVSPAHAARCLEAHPRIRLINGYGPTENTTFSLCHTITGADTRSGQELPIGRPIRGTDMTIMDPEGRPVAAGDPGELWVGGEGVALGYLGDDRLTAEKFLMHEGHRWYRTGDRVRQRADGVVEFLGRTDRQVKIQGHRIELDEVERVMGACPGIGTVAVLVADGNAETRHLVGFVSGIGDAKPVGQDIFAWLETRLPPAMIPHALHILDHLPVNLNGKVDRYALAARLQEPEAAGGEDGGGTGPATETETALVQIWSRCFARQGQPIPIRSDSNFLTLGGTSLLALRVAAEVRAVLGRDLAPVDVLRHPDLADQARWIDLAPLAQRHGPEMPRSATSIPLSRGQIAVIAASALDSSGCAYLVHQPLRIAPGTDRDALREAFVAVAQRHPMLRTAILPCKAVATADLRPNLPKGWWREWGSVADVPQDMAWPAELLQVINRPLDLSWGAMRADCWALADGGLLLVWTAHHFVVDEVAVNRVIDELGRTVTDGPESLPPVYGSPYGFPVVEQAWTDDVAIERRARDFAKLVGPLAPPLPAVPAAGDEQALFLPGELVQRIHARCDAWRCTPFLPLMAAYGLALQDTFGEAWRHVLTPYSRRCEPELMEPVGYLLDMRLMEAGARPGESLADALRRLHREIIAAQQPRFESAERLAEALTEISPEASTALFQFGFTWRHRSRAPVRFGKGGAIPLAVQQKGARFGLCLHLATDDAGIRASVEAVTPAFDSGAVAAFGRAFLARLDTVAALDITGFAAPHSDPEPARDAPSEAADPHRREEVRRAAADAWRTILGRPPADDGDDFLAAGGSSLLALRMAARLRRDAGLELNIAAFLARPDFAGLCRQLGTPRAAPTGRKPMYAILGPPDFERYVLVLPGDRGTALSMFTFANQLRNHLGPRVAVAMVDLQSMARQAPLDRPAHFIREQLVQVVRDLGEERLDSVVGASLGGILAGHLLNALGERTTTRVPLCMIDTYEPRILRTGRRWLWKRWAVRLVRYPLANAVNFVRKRASIFSRAEELAPVPAAERETQWTKQVWRNCFDELAATPLRVPGARVTLIHSRTTRRFAGILRWASRNGFSGREFDAIRVVNVDLPHGELLFDQSAVWVADALGRGW